MCGGCGQTYWPPVTPQVPQHPPVEQAPGPQGRVERQTPVGYLITPTAPPSSIPAHNPPKKKKNGT